MSAQISMASRTFEDSHVHDYWSTPPHGWIKINCDASRCQAMKLSGMVDIFRNHEDGLVGGSSSSRFTSSADLAEASEIRMGVLAVVYKGLKSMIIEFDNEGLANRLSRHCHSV
ncbi:hypothetical protein V6N13_142583 [Hibiscus sabdariffa]